MKNIFVIFLALALIFAGCGGEQQKVVPVNATQQNAPGSGQAPQPAPKPLIKEQIIVGAVLPLTGSLANVGEGMRNAMLLAVDDVNQKWKGKGKTLELHIEDTGCDPAKAVPAVSKLITVDNVIAIAGPTCSGESLATAQMINDNKIPTLSPSATSPDLTDKGGDYWFRIVPSDLSQGKVAAEYAIQKLNSKRAGILYLNNDWGVGLKNAFETNYKKSGGVIADEETMEKGVTDVRSQLAKVRSLNIDTLYIPCYPQECAVVLKQMSELGVKVNALGADGADDPKTLEQLGSAAEGFTLTIPSATASTEDFKNAYKNKYGNDPGAYGAQSYDVVRILADSIEKSGKYGEKIKNYLYAVQYSGASGQIAFDQNGDLAGNAVYDLKRWENGKFNVLGQVTTDLSK